MRALGSFRSTSWSGQQVGRQRRFSGRYPKKAEGAEESGSQSYVPPDEKDDRALKEALDLVRGAITDAAFPPNPKAAVP